MEHNKPTFFLYSKTLSKDKIPNPEIYKHTLPCGKIVTFEYHGDRLKVDIPAFLTDNIFFTIAGKEIKITNTIVNILEDRLWCEKNHFLLNKYGYLPLSKTQYRDVYTFCSYLVYEFTINEISISPSFPFKYYGENYKIDDLIGIFESLVLDQYKKFKNGNIILPLSGGMDSRLLLDLCIKERPRKKINVFSLGIENSGDIAIAKKVTSVLSGDVNHKIFHLETLNLEKILTNYVRSGFMVPLDRLLGHNLDDHYSDGLIISGIYGDVIFGDYEFAPKNFGEYIKREGIELDSEIDEKIVCAYNSLPQSAKLFRILLRCQKLTKVSLHVLNNNFRIFSPFIDDQVVASASQINVKNLYPRLVKNLMSPKLSGILHQSSLSYFTHPPFFRILEKRFFQITLSKMATPYFTEEFLKKYGIEPNHSPKPISI